MEFIKKTFTVLTTAFIMVVLCLMLTLKSASSIKADEIYVSEETGRTYGVQWASNTSFGILNQTAESRVCVYAYLAGLQYSVKSVEILRNGSSIGKWTLNTDDRFIYVYIRFMNVTSLQTDSGALYFQATVPNSWYNSTFKIIVNGFWSSPSYTLSFYDAVAPTYTSYTGGSSSWAQSRTLSVSGASDKHSGLASSAYCFYSSSSTSAPGSGSCSWQSSSSKTIGSTTNTYYHAYLRDGSGNVSYAGYQQVRVDRTAPGITVSKTAAFTSSNYYVDNTSTYIYATISDPHSGLKTSEVCIIKGGSSTQTCYSYTSGTYIYATSSYFASGTNKINFCASDNSTSTGGNGICSAQFILYLDETHPTLSVSCVGDWCNSGYGADTSSNYIKANVSDTYSGISTIRYCYIKPAGASSYTRYTFDDGAIIYGYNSFLSSGINYMYFYAEDIAGNSTTSATYTLYLDESHPTFSVSRTTGMQTSSSATETYYVDDTNTYISTTVSDTLSGLSAAYIYVKRAGASSYSSYSYSSATKIYATSSYFSSGLNEIYFYAVDKAGNTSTSSTYKFYLDETHPTISVSATEAWKKQYVAANVSNNIKATLSDSHAGMSSSYVYVKKAGASSYSSYSYTSGTTIHASSTYFATGVNYLYFYGIDGVGNTTTSSTITVYIDKTAPVVDINNTFDIGNVNFVNETITVPVSTISDANSGLYGSTIASATTLTKSGTVNSSNDLVFGFDQISNQKLAFTITVKDAVGNTTTKNIEIGVTWKYDDSVEELLNEGLSATSWTADINSLNSGRQLSYSLPTNLEDKLNTLNLFGIDPHIEDLEIRYVYAVVKTAKGGLGEAAIKNLYSISKETSYAQISNVIVSPIGLINNPDEHVEVIVYINGIGQVVGKASLSTIFETALTSTFDMYKTEMGSYEGAGLGEDGTVVSYTDDSATKRAVTLGASNTIHKRDVYGNLEWSKKVTGAGKIEIKKIINNDNGILVLAETTTGNINGTVYPVMGGRDVLVIRMDKQGNILFTTVVGSTGGDYVVDGDLSSDMIAILTKTNEKSGSLITMGLNGTNPSLKKISVDNDIELASVAINGSKVAILGATSDKTIKIDNLAEEVGNTGERDIFLHLFDGETGWVRRIGGTGNDIAYSIAMDDLHIYVAAQTEDVVVNENTGITKLLDSYGGKDGLILKYDYLGNLVTTTTVGGEQDDIFNQIIVEGDNVLVAGLSGSSVITASHFLNNSYNINLIGEVDTMIITLSKDFIIQSGLNLAGEEGELVQEIGIHQYTEQVMILSATGVSTQRLLEKSFTFEHTYENGVLNIVGSSEIASAQLIDGDQTLDVTNGIEIAPGAYEVKVRSVDGQIVNKIITVGSDAELLANVTTEEPTKSINYSNVIAIPAISLLVVLLVVLNVLKQRKNIIMA